MKNDMFLFALCLSACFSKATTDAETVWLKDVTTRLQADKRGFTGPDFPDQLSFHLKRKTHNLVLNLERNYLIDPNIDTYVVQRTMDGQPLLDKIQNLEQTDVAYYQDIYNGAFMAARCVKRSSGQCEILINGNIRLGKRSYNLRRSEADAVKNDFLAIMGLRGKQYVLEDQEYIQSGMPAENNEQTNVTEQNIQDNHIDRLQYGQDEPNLVINPDDIFSARPNVARLQNIFPTGAINYGRTTTKNDADGAPDRDAKAREDLKEYLIHVVHGVHQLYSGIEDASISIAVRIKYFVIDQRGEFQHFSSRVNEHEDKMKIDGDKYLQDLKNWDLLIGSREYRESDQVMLFTKYWLYSGDRSNLEVDGRSITGGVCDIGRRVQIVRVSDFFNTIRTAAHGLGHALGAIHDGSFTASLCRPDNKFIMSPIKPNFYRKWKHSLNPWRFSICSVEAFKITLVNKLCVKFAYFHDQDTVDYFERVLSTPTGQRFDANYQCVLRNGIGSTMPLRNIEHICSAMTCTDPVITRTDNGFMSAATGTICGDNKTCQKGLCVATPQKLVFTHNEDI